MKVKISREARCICAAPLPDHLADLMRGRGMTHVCSCERVWKVDAQGADFVHEGAREVNPFAEALD